MSLWNKLRREREERLADSHAAIRKQERLKGVIDWQAAQAADLGDWARERLEMNHLTELFLTTRGRR